MKFEKIEYKALTSPQKEIYNFQKIAAILAVILQRKLQQLSKKASAGEVSFKEDFSKLIMALAQVFFEKQQVSPSHVPNVTVKTNDLPDF